MQHIALPWLVTGRFESIARELLDVTIVTDHGETEVIEATPSHPFYSADRRDYIPAAQLRLDERLRTADDPPGHASARVKSLVPRAPPQGEPGFRVYNLEVHGLHTYHVGDAGVLVHNQCATKLRKNMANGPGKVKFRAGDVAHHIVSRSDSRAAKARRILRSVGIRNLDEAINGVRLTASCHNGIHTGDYYRAVTERLKLGLPEGRAGVERELKSIGQQLRRGVILVPLSP